MNDFDQLIDRLAADAGPVRVQRSRTGRMILAAVVLATLAMIALTIGLRPDVLTLTPPPLLALAAGLMAILSAATGASAERMARPQVGAPAPAAPWLLTALLLLPLAALAAIVANPAEIGGLAFEPGLRCLTFGMASGLGTVAFLTLWLRKGAPVSPERAAWLCGLAGGGVGALAVTLECARDEIAHLGLWHVAIVPLMGVLARLALPRLLRW